MWRYVHWLYVLLTYLVRPFLKSRVQFEEQNQLPASRSFKLDRMQARVCFTFSSEGELEQVRPLIQEMLVTKQHVELIYSSASVEQAVAGLYQQYPVQIRLLRLPLLTAKFSGLHHWVSAPWVVLVRYDFFPMLMDLSRTHALGVVWATFKNRRHRLQSLLWQRWYQWFYGHFQWIVAATPIDEWWFKQLKFSSASFYDFRLDRIQQRLQSADTTLDQKWPLWRQWQQQVHLENTCHLMAGSIWEIDLNLLKNEKMTSQILEKQLSVTLVPHKLQENWSQLLKQYWQGPVYLVSEQTNVDEMRQLCQQHQQSPGVWVVLIKGILCELYGEANLSYVGGGFGVSIHSVWEPYLAGSQVLCGPKTHRSTEYETIASSDSGRIQSASDFTQLQSAIVEYVTKSNLTAAPSIGENLKQTWQPPISPYR